MNERPLLGMNMDFYCWPRAPRRSVNVGDCLSAVYRRSWIDLGLNLPVKLSSGCWSFVGFCRIDCQIATRWISERARAASIYKEARFSDHAPLIIDYDMAL